MSDTEVPTVISADSVGEWSDSVDVLVVGMGIAGSCAAIAAAEAGANVLALERAGAIGGTSALAGGHFYLGAGTAVQEATGHTDSVEEMVKYLEVVSPDPDSAKIRAYCEGSVEHFEWLESVGIEFERSFYPGKNVVQPGTEGLMFTGNEKVWPFRGQAVPAPRGHKVRAPSATGGAAMMRTFAQRLTQLDIPVRVDTGATALVADAAGRIVGVQWRRFDEIGTIRAGSVILAAGGYVMNQDMIAAHTPRLNARFMPLGTTYDDGLGIRLGISAGAGLAHMAGAFLTASFYPPADLLKGIIVNQAGERFVAEDSYHSRIAAAVLEQPDAKAFLILDDTTMAWPELQLVKFIDGFDSIDDLERTLGIPAGALERTLAEYNDSARDRVDPVLGKHPDWVTTLDKGPWGAFDLSPDTATYVGFTLGGVRTSKDGQVLRDDATVIDGCSRSAPARRILLRIAVDTPAERALARVPTSVGAQACTRRVYVDRSCLRCGRGGGRLLRDPERSPICRASVWL